MSANRASQDCEMLYVDLSEKRNVLGFVLVVTPELDINYLKIVAESGSYMFWPSVIVVEEMEE